MLVMKSGNGICIQECQRMLQSKSFQLEYTNNTDYPYIKLGF